MNTRWVLAGIAIIGFALYVLTYFCLSLNGTYRPDIIGGNGIKTGLGAQRDTWTVITNREKSYSSPLLHSGYWTGTTGI